MAANLTSGPGAGDAGGFGGKNGPEAGAEAVARTCGKMGMWIGMASMIGAMLMPLV